MCGFVALIGPGEKPPLVTLEEMRDRLAHRGPDGSGAWIGSAAAGHVALGFRRLAIQDTRQIADQPMRSSDGAITLVFNGEIYNFVELRDELRALGHSFRTHGDTEVLLQAYQAWGPAMLGRLNGMFAFFLWDADRSCALIARDRFGEKPLYMGQLADGKWAFASEIKAILAHPDAPLEFDMDAFGRVFAGQIPYGLPATLFRGISLFKAGHHMSIGADGQVREYKPYWSPRYDRAFSERDRPSLMQEFRERLESSLVQRMRSDVRVTACLSGGLDSSTLVSLLAKNMLNGGAPLEQAISVRFPQDPTIDEGSFIDEVLRRTGVEGVSLTPDGAQLVSDVRRLHWHQESIVAGPSMYLEWSLMRDARALGYKVILDGQGADEILAGYQNYFQAYQAEQVTRPWLLPRALRQGRLRDARLREAALRYPDPERRFGLREGMSVREMLAYRLRRSDTLSRMYGAENLPTEDEIGLLRFELAMNMARISLPSNLHSGDRNSMAHGIECRYPFLDYELVEFASHLPDWALIEHGWSKYILRTSMQDVLPRSVAWRPDKVGFAAPQDAWLAGPEMRRWMEERIFDAALRDIPGHDSAHIEAMWRAHAAAERDHSAMLWKWASAAEILDIGRCGYWRRGLS